MVSSYKELTTSLLATFPNTPLLGTGKAVDVLKGYSSEASHVSYVGLFDPDSRTTQYFRRQGPKILFTMAVRPYTEEELPTLEQLIIRNTGNHLELTELNLCSPMLLDVLRMLSDNSRVYTESQNLGRRDIVTDLKRRRMNLINGQLNDVDRVLLRTSEGYAFTSGRSIYRTYDQTVNIAQGNYVALGGEVEPVVKLCKVAYLPEELEEHRAEEQALDMLAKTDKECVREAHFTIFGELARSIGYGKAEDTLGRRVKGMWDPSVDPAQLDELHAFLRTDNVLYGVIRELQTSFKPQITT